MIQSSNLFSTLSKSGRNAARLNFEIQFRNIERNITEKLNKEISDVVKETSRADEVDVMQKQSESLNEDMAKYRTYLFGVQGNKERLADLASKVTDIDAVFVEGDTALTQEQADAINTTFDEVVSAIENLNIMKHPDIRDGDIIFSLQGHLEDIKDYHAVAGTIDASDADSATNDNRAMWDDMQTLLSKLNTAVTVHGDTIDFANQLIIDSQTELFSIESRYTEISLVDQQRVADKVDKLKERYSQLLQAISLSFEVSNGFADYMGEALDMNRRPKPGSVMNLFA